MENNRLWKKRISNPNGDSMKPLKWPRYITALTLVMVLLVIGYLVLANTITMHAKQDKYLIGTTNISTTLRNRTLQTITYGAAFELEYLVDGEWVKMGREATTINFEAWGKSLLPFTSASIDYPVSIYSEMEKVGTYRLVVNVIHGDSISSIHCPFEIVAGIT